MTGLAKLRERDASCMPADEVLYMATAGGAYAMGLPDCDCLAAGKKADLVMIDLQTAEYAAGEQPCEKSGLQRQQAECETDDGKRKSTLRGWNISHWI